MQRRLAIVLRWYQKYAVIETVLHSDRLVTAAPSPMIEPKIVGDVVVVSMMRDVALDGSDLSITSFMVSEFCRRFCASTCLTSRVSYSSIFLITSPLWSASFSDCKQNIGPVLLVTRESEWFFTIINFKWLLFLWIGLSKNKNQNQAEIQSKVRRSPKRVNWIRR